MNFTPVFFLVATLAWSSLAQAGYLKPTASEVPEAVRQSAKSVFRIVPWREKPTEFHPKVLETLTASPDVFSRQQYLRAQAAGRGRKTIPVHYGGYGSAFLLGDQRTLISARHTWDATLWNALLGELSEIENLDTRLNTLVNRVIESEVKFELYDSSGTVIFSPAKGDTGKITFILNYRFFEELQGRAVTVSPTVEGLNDQAFDFIGIRLSRPLVDYRALELSSGAGDTFFGAGYPSNFDENHQRPTNSDGKGLWLSKGKRLTAEVGARAYKMGALKKEEADQIFDQRFSFIEAEAGPGISGGPLLDSEGKVVSLVVAGLWDGTPGTGRPVTAIPSPKLFKVGTARFPEMFQTE